ncbi:hypothetical protein acsn021_04150 [Anaerocolumna cellulosilytica]|uniref:Uncharacterized protein n=1 Tax=Anaerocolumna cellulosilytica TaxID=433286 RepID=A0A6S6QT68_9FIRM|nr:hypothetical protein [Anaerocolumna cellulosilytica]BCJ92846.1 hypothetical protein acsn021_04150 [Anaerocolumna cellulosilytica]
MSKPNNTTIAKFDDVNTPKYNLYIGTLAEVAGPKFLSDLHEFIVSSVVQKVIALKVVLEVKEQLQLSIDEEFSVRHVRLSVFC